MSAIKQKIKDIVDPLSGVKLKLSALESTVEELVINKKQIEILRDTSEDDRVRFNASKLINDTEMKIIELKIKIQEYEAPATQKTDLNVFFPDRIEIETIPTKETK